MSTLLSIFETVEQFISDIFSFISGNMSIDLGLKLVLGYFFIIWAAFIIWVIKDITNRTTNILIQTLSIFLILLLTPIFGLPIYLLIRPRTTLFEQYYEEGDFEEGEGEDDGEGEDFHHCPHCNYLVSSEFRFCPKCAIELTKTCTACNKQIRTEWVICPYCGNKEEEVKEEVVVKK